MAFLFFFFSYSMGSIVVFELTANSKALCLLILEEVRMSLEITW